MAREPRVSSERTEEPATPAAEPVSAGDPDGKPDEIDGIDLAESAAPATWDAADEYHLWAAFGMVNAHMAETTPLKGRWDEYDPLLFVKSRMIPLFQNFVNTVEALAEERDEDERGRLKAALDSYFVRLFSRTFIAMDLYGGFSFADSLSRLMGKDPYAPGFVPPSPPVAALAEPVDTSSTPAPEVAPPVLPPTPAGEVRDRAPLISEEERHLADIRNILSRSEADARRVYAQEMGREPLGWPALKARLLAQDYGDRCHCPGRINIETSKAEDGFRRCKRCSLLIGPYDRRYYDPFMLPEEPRPLMEVAE